MSGRSRTVSIEILGDARNADKAFKEVEKSADGLGSKLGKAALVGGAAIATIGVGAGIAAFQIGESFDEAYDTIRVGTGATGEALEGLQDSFKNVVSNVPTDFGTASTAIADLNTALGITGKPLEDLATQFINLGRITGEDLPNLISNGTRVFGDWGIAVEDQSAAMDTLFKTSQTTGIGVTDLMSKVVQFGAPMRLFGFSFEETAALMGRFEKEGVNTELVMGSLRIAAGKFAKEGIPLREGLEDTIARIQELGPSAEATALAMEIFGARAGPDMAATILDGKFSIDELMKTIGGSEETINTAAEATDDWREKWQILQNKGKVFLEPLASGLFNVVGILLDRAVPALDTLQAFISNTVVPAVTPFVSQLGDIVRAVGGGEWQSAFSNAIGLMGDLGGVAAGLGQRLLDAVLGIDYMGIAGGIWTGILTGLGMLGDAGMQLAEWLIGAVTGIDYSGIASTIWNGIIGGLTALGDAAIMAGEWLLSLFQGVDWSGMASSVVDGLQSGFETITDFGQRIVDWISGQLGSADWGALQASLESGLGSALETLNSLGENEGIQNFVALIEDKLQPVLEALANDVMPILQPTIDNLKESFDDISETVSERLGPTIEQAQETFESLLPALQTIATVVGGVLIAALIGLGEFLAKVLPPAVEIAFDVINGLLVIIETLATTVQNMVDLVKALIEGDWSAAWEAAKALVDDFVGGMIEAVTPLVGTISGIFTDLMGAVLGILGELGSWMLNEGGPMLVSSLADGLAWLVSEAPGGAFHLWVNLNTRILELMGSLASWLATEGGPKLVSMLVDGLQYLFSEDTAMGVLGQYVKLQEMINTQVSAIAGWMLTEGGPTLIAKLIEGLQDLFSVDTAVGVVGQFYKLQTRLNEVTGEIASAAVGWGAEVVSGFVSGMTNMLTSSDTYQNLYNAAKDLAKGMLDGAKDALGISSPSREGQLVGQWFYRGIIEGMDEGDDGIYDAGKRSGARLVAGTEAGMDEEARAGGAMPASPKPKPVGVAIGKELGEGIAIGVRDESFDASHAAHDLGSKTVEGIELGMDDEARAGGALPAAPHPKPVGVAMGADLGAGIAEGTTAGSANAYAAGKQYGGALGKGVNDGYEDEIISSGALPSSGMPAPLPSSGMPIQGPLPSSGMPITDPNGAPAAPGQAPFDPEIMESPGTPSGAFDDSGGLTDEQQALIQGDSNVTAEGGGSGPLVGESVGGGSSIGPDTLYYVGSDDIAYILRSPGSQPQVAYNWLARALEKGVLFVRYTGGSLGGDGTYKTTALMAQVQAAGALPGINADPGGNGALATLTGSGGGGGGGINLVVNLGNEQLVDTVLSAPLPGMSLSVEI